MKKFCFGRKLGLLLLSVAMLVGLLVISVPQPALADDGDGALMNAPIVGTILGTPIDVVGTFFQKTFHPKSVFDVLNVFGHAVQALGNGGERALGTMTAGWTGHYHRPLLEDGYIAKQETFCTIAGNTAALGLGGFFGAAGHFAHSAHALGVHASVAEWTAIGSGTGLSVGTGIVVAERAGPSVSQN